MVSSEFYTKAWVSVPHDWLAYRSPKKPQMFKEMKTLTQGQNAIRFLCVEYLKCAGSKWTGTGVYRRSRNWLHRAWARPETSVSSNICDPTLLCHSSCIQPLSEDHHLFELKLCIYHFTSQNHTLKMRPAACFFVK